MHELDRTSVVLVTIPFLVKLQFYIITNDVKTIDSVYNIISMFTTSKVIKKSNKYKYVLSVPVQTL